MVASEVLGGVLTLTKGHVGRLEKNPSSDGSCPFAVGAGILHSYQDRMRHLTGPWWLAVPMIVCDDDCAFAELKLRAMVLADLHALDESERVGEPRHGRPNI
jgi:hypothetical protein